MASLLLMRRSAGPGNVGEFSRIGVSTCPATRAFDVIPREPKRPRNPAGLLGRLGSLGMTSKATSTAFRTIRDRIEPANRDPPTLRRVRASGSTPAAPAPAGHE